MGKVHLVMPMAGGGTRFMEHGFDLPKPLIELKGRPFFFWAAESVNHFIDVQDITFVVLEEHVKDFEIDKVIRRYYPQAKIHVISEVLNGAVLTCLEGVNDIGDNLPLLFNDCDHAFISDSFYKYTIQDEFDQIDGALLTFKANSPVYSYVVYDETGGISGTVEKDVASSDAICGAYYFRNCTVFRNAAESYLERCAYREFYMSGLYNELVKSGRHLRTFPLDEHISYGTPEEYENVKNDSRLDVFLQIPDRAGRI